MGKVGLRAYLFFVAAAPFLSVSVSVSVFAQEQEDSREKIDSAFLQAYFQTYNLSTTNRLSVSDREVESDPFTIYFDHLEQAIELFIQEDEEKYELFKDQTDDRISALKKIDSYPTYTGYFLAEIRLHESILDLKFGRQLYAALNFNKAHRNIENNIEDFPDFLLQYKTAGLIDVITSSVPDNYNWLVSLFGFNKELDQGLQRLSKAKQFGKIVEQEIILFEGATQLFLLEGSLDSTFYGLSTFELPITFQYIYSFLFSKYGDGESSMREITALASENAGVTEKLPHVDYLLGINQLQVGETQSSIRSFHEFLSEFKGFNLVKDSHYRLAIGYQLLEVTDSSKYHLSEILDKGNTFTDSDRYAERVAQEGQLPAAEVTQLRLLTDGGYYDSATELIQDNDARFVANHPDHIEWEYRKARLNHKSGEVDKAIPAYLETMELSGLYSQKYFAPNSSLQLGFIYQSRNDGLNAEKYFKQVLEYKKYPYESSIRNKAKNSLKSLKKD